MSSAGVEIFTIGFTKKSARDFFEKLRAAGVRRVVDMRLNNTSQLAGFSKLGDLEYFLGQVLRAGYVHLPILAPTQEMLDAYKKNGGDWETYARDFVALMASREIERNVPREVVARILSEFQRRGWLTLGRGSITLTDAQALAEIDRTWAHKR